MPMVQLQKDINQKGAAGRNLLSKLMYN